MNEFELINQLIRRLPANDTVRVGPGDDCAVLDLGVPGRLLLFKTDAVVEGVHFTRETVPVVDIAKGFVVGVQPAETGEDDRDA